MSNRTYPQGLQTTAAELQQLRGLPVEARLSAAAGSTNICNVTITWHDVDGNQVAPAWLYNVWLSDATSGFGLTATTASGTVQAKSGEGTVVGTLTTKKALVVQCKSAGSFVLEITDSAKTAFKVCVQNPVTGKVYSLTLSSAKYG